MSDIVTFSGNGAEPSVLLSQPATVFTVNTADDAGGGNCQGDGLPCSLRRALFWANFTPNNMIVFNIPGAGVHTINLTSQFPDIVTGTTLDATTQPGYIGKPLIEIKGDLMTGAKEGLRTARPNVTIRGFAVNGMPGIAEGGSVIAGSGIVILSYLGEPLATNVTVESNFLGTNPDGSADLGNDGNGIQIYDADSNNIGGTIPQARNILSGNGVVDEDGTKAGVGFAITGGNYNKIYNNYVGTDVTGALSLGNFQGAFVAGIANEIGGDQPGMGNVISGNGGPVNINNQCSGQGISVVQLYSPSTGEALTDGTSIKGNLIGTSASGLSKVRNCTTGVASTGNLNTTIGSITSEGRNTISGNDWDAIWCGYNDSAFFPISGGCYIMGNEIGTNINGNAAIANTEDNNSCIGFCLITDTIWLPTEPIDFALVGSPGQTAPESACQGNCNLISGNRSIEGGFGGGAFLKAGNGFGMIVSNFIGTNRTGTQALPNQDGGTGYSGSVVIGAVFGDGQGGLIPAGNLISGNDYGARIESIDVGGLFFMKGNTVGFSADGLSAIPNGGLGGDSSQGLGASAQGGTSVLIGGSTPLERNTIGNTTSIIPGRGDGINTFANIGSSVVVQGNYIGLDRQGNAAPNTGDGIEAKGEGRTIIGGGGLGGSENTIANNGRAGVFIFNFTGSFSTLKTERVAVRGNIIKNNGGLGIDITNLVQGGPNDGDGVTENDCQDLDTGPNGLQNYPELYAPIQNQDGTLRIDTVLRSLPSRNYTIDYYLNNQPDPTNHGEGQTYLGVGSMTTNGNSFASASFNTTQQLPTTAFITATATDEEGNTSEFSCAAGVCAAEGSTFEEATNAATLPPACIVPIVVTTNGDENDLDGENPVQNRDGLCDVD
ncbi:MAG: hypothetical protein ABL959_15335, partial [Pyrinomonadaceae bacterium]